MKMFHLKVWLCVVICAPISDPSNYAQADFELKMLFLCSDKILILLQMPARIYVIMCTLKKKII